VERDDDESDERNELGDDTDEGDDGTELRKREEKRSARRYAPRNSREKNSL